VVEPRESVGVLTSTFCKEGVDGRIRLWGGRARKSERHSSPRGLMSNHRADYMQGTRLSFRSKEDAIHFAEKQGECLSCPISFMSQRSSAGLDYYVYVPVIIGASTLV
jgi:hypothetical protein